MCVRMCVCVFFLIAAFDRGVCVFVYVFVGCVCVYA
jgi:hypothetical protein